MTYNEFVTAITAILVYETETVDGVVAPTDPDVVAILPRLIEYAEGRLHRDLDLLVSRKVFGAGVFIVGGRAISAPPDLISVISLACVTPSSAGSVEAGVRNVLQRLSLEFLEVMWPRSASRTGVPRYYASLDNATFIVAPSPDQAYRLEWRYIFRPTALSSSNTTTYLSLTYPDLMIAAAMIFGSGYIRNFGAQADDPKMAMSWEMQYQTLLANAKAEVMRTKAEVEHDLSPTAPPAQMPQA